MVPVSWLLYFMHAIWMAGAEVVSIGNPASSSDTLLRYSQDISFILLDYDLVNGTLHAFEFTTASRIAALRLQIWRLQRASLLTPHPYLLIYEQAHTSAEARNHTIPPLTRVDIQAGDKMGFLSEGTDSGVVYDFQPNEYGATTRTRSFPSTPVAGESYDFDAIPYNTYVFAFSVLIDTDYGPAPSPPTTTTGISTTTTPSSTTTSPTTTPIISTTPLTTTSTPPPQTEFPIGNNITSGDTLTNVSGIFILDDYDLLEGHVTSFRFYNGAPNQTVWLQIWRPLGNDTYMLVSQTNVSFPDVGPQQILLSPAIEVEDGDKIGFTSTSGHVPVTYTDGSPDETGSNISFLPWPSENDTVPEVGEVYTFSDGFSTYIFAIAVDVDTAYTTPRTPTGGGGWTVGGLTEGEKQIIIWVTLIYVIIVVVSTLYALWVIVTRSRKVDLVPKVTNIIATGGSDWVIPRENLYLYETLAVTQKGTMMKAKVFGVGKKQGWTSAAVKMLIPTASDQEKASFLQEIQVMRSIKAHANVLQIIGCCIEKDPIMMVAEAVPFGSLLDYLRELKDTHIRMNIAGHSNYTLTMDILGFGAQVARGMAYLSSQRILHRDLAARNIFLGEGRLCKISHFGLAQDIVECRQYERAIKCPVPIRWMAPESIASNIYTIKGDVWSFGIVLWEIITLGATPYHELDVYRVVKAVRRGYRLERPPHCREELFTVMSSCWRSKAQDRPSFDNLATTLQELHDKSSDLIQLEKYPEDNYEFKVPKVDEEEIV